MIDWIASKLPLCDSLQVTSFEKSQIVYSYKCNGKLKQEKGKEQNIHSAIISSKKMPEILLESYMEQSTSY